MNNTERRAEDDWAHRASERLRTPRHSTAYACRLEEYVKRVVDAAPPLSPAQLDRLALLLYGASQDRKAPHA